MGNGRSGLRPEVIADLTEATDFTPGELNDLYRQYRHDCIQHGHGRKLTMKLNEFKDMYEEIFPGGDADKFAEHVFRTYDKNGDGVINFKEFIMNLNIQLKGSHEDKLNWLFDLYDVAKNNYISRNEALEVIQVIHDLHSGILPAEDTISPQELTDHIFKRADKDHDGKVDRSAFLSAAGQSKTLKLLLNATAKVASQPFTMRKERSGSFGRKMVDYSSRSRSGSQISSAGSGSRRGSVDEVLGRSRGNSRDSVDENLERMRAYSARESAPTGREKVDGGRLRAGSAREVPNRYKKSLGPSEVMLGARPRGDSVKL